MLNCWSSFPSIPSSYQVLLWKQDRFVVLRPLQIEFFRSLLDEQKMLKAELLRAKLRGEVSQLDYVQANADFDDEIEGIAQQIHALRSQRGTLDAFIRFSKLMLVDVSAAWQRADAEQRL